MKYFKIVIPNKHLTFFTFYYIIMILFGIKRYIMEEQFVMYVLLVLAFLLCIEQIIRLVNKIKGTPDKNYHIDVTVYYTDKDKKK